MVAELGHDDMRQQTWTGKTALDRSRRGRSFHYAITAGAGELRPHVADDLEAVGNVLQLLGNIFTKLPQLAPQSGQQSPREHA